MDELAAFILARVGEDQDLANQALHDPGFGGILGVHVRTRHLADIGRSPDMAGHELLIDPLACHIMNQNPQKVVADCVAKQRLIAHVQRIHRNYQQAGEQDSMRGFLELMALPWRDHPDYQTQWLI